MFALVFKFLNDDQKNEVSIVCKDFRHNYYSALDKRSLVRRLIYRSKKGYLDGVKVLIEKYNVYPSDKAFELAVSNGRTSVVKYLIGKVDPAAGNNRAIRMAARNGHFKIVKLLLSTKNVDPTAGKNYAIRWAARYGYLGIVKCLLRVCDPAADFNYAIRWAAKGGHLEVVKFLVSTGKVDPAAYDNQPIRWAYQNGHYNVYRYLLSTGKCTLTNDQKKLYDSR